MTIVWIIYNSCPGAVLPSGKLRNNTRALLPWLQVGAVPRSTAGSICICAVHSGWAHKCAPLVGRGEGKVSVAVATAVLQIIEFI